MLKLKLQHFALPILRTWYKEPTHWKRPWCWERLRAGEEGDDRMSWLNGITDSMDMSLGKLQKILKDREAWHALVCGVTKTRMWLSDWTTKVISEIEDEGPNSITKDVCIILIAQEILKILRAVDKDQIYVRQIYLSHIYSVIWMIQLNHNIEGN